MTTTTRIAGLLGPTLMAMVASEFPLVQPRLYDEQTPPVVYLSGVLLFVAGLAIVRWHNLWRRDWAVLVTLCGWFFLALGLIRMFAASRYRQAYASTGPAFFMVLEGALFVIGLFLTVKAYARSAGSKAAPLERCSIGLRTPGGQVPCRLSPKGEFRVPRGRTQPDRAAL